MATLVGRSGYVDGPVRLHHLEYGNRGTPVVILPGITTPAAMLEFVSTDLGRDHRVWTLDIRGRGSSDTPADGFTLDDYAGDVAAVVEGLGLERPALVGHSMGARIAAATAVRFPDLVGPLVLADPPLTGPGRGEYPMSLEAFMSQLDAAKSGGGADELRQYFPTLTEEQLAVRAQWLHTCDENAVREIVAELPPRGLPRTAGCSSRRRCCSCTATRARWSPRRRCRRCGRPPPTASSSCPSPGRAT